MSDKLVYLIDDDADIRRLAEVSFQALSSHRLHTFATGPELNAQLKAEMPDLIIFDVMMPEQSGPELLVELRESFGEALAPAVFLTAKVQPAEVAELSAFGVLEVLSKPFAPKQLVEQIDTLLG